MSKIFIKSCPALHEFCWRDAIERLKLPREMLRIFKAESFCRFGNGPAADKQFLSPLHEKAAYDVGGGVAEFSEREKMV